ncbi:MAG: neutral zinc metallopeptidase [Alphaproteobacteria bacterium]|nr:neutral zinc metallopeptidase [Alphaproteobacteria bacterium]
MRLDDDQDSGNFIDDTGRGGGFGFGGGGFGGGGGLIGLLFGLVLSRFGIVGVVILLLGYCALTTLGSGGGPTGYPSGPQVSQATGGAGTSTLSQADKHLVLGVLGSTERTWTKLLAAEGQSYAPTTLVFYSGADQSGCGAAQSAMGPFYCPTDRRIYLDTSFFRELTNRFHASGDFADAYVIAHEVGHHVQDLLGTLARADRLQAQAGTAGGNAVQVRVELQADCFAGVWAANARNKQGQPILEAGDAEEGLRAAAAIGDDTLQQEAQGRIVPDSFTHGSSAQRVKWLRRGLESGDPAQCDTFSGAV